MRRLLLIVFFSLMAVSVWADERILDFNSDITVHEDGRIRVVETIKVRSSGTLIKHGIYRAIPILSRDAYGNFIKAPLDVLSVTREGEPEPVYMDSKNKSLYIYIGSPNHLLEQGEHTYTITYTMDRQLGFFSDYDELYWNVTGNYWQLPIDRVSASVHLPAGVDDLTAEAYTGRLGAKEQNFESHIDSGRSYFETTQSLAKGEGLSIVVTWPKGVVQEPTFLHSFNWYIKDNRDTVAMLLGLLVLSIFYLVVWFAYGRDPKPGVIIPQYDPPVGYSPGAVRYIMRRGADNKTFSAALVSLATKGYLLLVQKDAEYAATRTDKVIGTDLGPGEKALLKRLYKGFSSKTIDFNQKNQMRIQSAMGANRLELQKHYDKDYFLNNSHWLVPGGLITLVTLVCSLIFSPSGTGFFMVWLTLWTMALIFLFSRAFNAWRHYKSTKDLFSVIHSSFFFIGFLVFELASIVMLLGIASVIKVVAFLLLLIINPIFYQLLKAPTLAGRALFDKLEGLKLYLEVAEQDEWQFKHPPEKTPELFERLFPYAMALDLEQRWADRFTAVFADLERRAQPYQFRGVRSNTLSYQNAGFSTALSNSINRAASPVYSSSRSGSSRSSGRSSGSSGGGGGGGGGGGW
ncbi:DUF2207 domain-containing protein [Nitrincola sp.]|uniref:DUF2207 domain-containing protein n=1 Tax=Nitrincola sp. TaxID=1926584 RepID=UPI003A91A807